MIEAFVYQWYYK